MQPDMTIHKAVAAFFAALIGMLVVIGVDEGSIRAIFTEENIATIGTVVAAAVAIARTVWWVPNKPTGGGFVDDENGGMRLATVLVVAALLLAACSPLMGNTLEQRFYALVDNYLFLREEAEAYAVSGPLCSEQEVVGCVRDDIVIALDDVTDEFDPRLQAAIALMSSGSLSENDKAAQIALARQALRELAAARNVGVAE